MGRDNASVRIDKKPNVVSVKSTGASCGPKPSGESLNLRKSEAEEGLHVGRGPEKQEMVGVKSVNHKTGSPGRFNLTPEPSKSREKSISSPVSQASRSASHQENVAAGLYASSNTNSIRSPMNAKQSQQNTPFSALRAQKSETNKYHDEEDNWSMASSAATSRTVRSRVTVGVAPSFQSAQRAAQRKEFYSKLEQKHQALKAEKMEYEARTKEEQEEAIRQMRKSMVVKANPVPTFYRQGPPPKVELKKLPLTRAKSPNLTRRKSCGDPIHSPANEKSLCARVRHSIGTYKPTSATSSPIKPIQARTPTTIKGVKQPNGTPKASPRSLSKEINSDITVHS